MEVEFRILLVYSLNEGELISFNLPASFHEKEPPPTAPIGNDYWCDQVLE